MHERDPPNCRFLKISRTEEEEISSNIGAVMTQVGFSGFIDTDSYNDLVDQMYDIGTMKRCMIANVKVAMIPSRNVSQK